MVDRPVLQRRPLTLVDTLARCVLTEGSTVVTVGRIDAETGTLWVRPSWPNAKVGRLKGGGIPLLNLPVAASFQPDELYRVTGTWGDAKITVAQVEHTDWDDGLWTVHEAETTPTALDEDTVLRILAHGQEVGAVVLATGHGPTGPSLQVLHVTAGLVEWARTQPVLIHPAVVPKALA